MKRRTFLTNTLLVLPSISLFGISIIPTKTYRSSRSVFTNEELTLWCEKNGGYYAQDNELVLASYQYVLKIPHEVPNAFKNPQKSFRHTIFPIPSSIDKYEALNHWLIQFRYIYGRQYKFILKDIYYPNYVIENVKMMPLIALTREELPAGKQYRFDDPIFDLKTRKQLMPMFEQESDIMISFNGFRTV